ncbi:MATE family efflux transporter [Clostridium tunisiense]|uniref:MATE family efflux transporter n=1 Tax=Clostridium tunisiense TaxID=219748 RepID=UPI00030B2F01|nr:MATE family efflux transporter [Clostridium tunisiense]
MEETTEMSQKEVRKKIYSMILPITFESVLQMMAGFVAAGFIGRLDAVAISALGISNRITNIIWALFKGISTGGSVFVAQSYGARDHKKIKHVAMQTLLSCLMLVIILAVILFFNGDFFLGTIYKNSSETLRANAYEYIKIVAFGLPFQVIMLVVAAVLQGMGNAKTPMKIAFIMNGTNVIVSPIFIFGFLGIPALGLRGAAVGLVIAQFVGAMVGLYVLFNKDGVLAGSKSKESFVLDKHQIKEVYKVGMPSALESIFWQVSAIILTTLILRYGDIAMASYQQGLQAESISFMPAVGFAVAATAFTGQTIGARNKKLGKRYMREILIGSTILTTFSSVILLFLPHFVMGLLTDKQPIIELGSKYLILMGLVQIPQNISACLNGALRGAGFTKVPMYSAGIGIWLVRIPLAFYFTYVLKLSVIAIWSAMCIDLVVRFMVSILFYKRKNIYKEEDTEVSVG